MKYLLTLSICLFSLGLFAGNPLTGKSLAKQCQSCHGQNGITNKGMHPNLAGQNEVYLVWQLMNFKEDKRIGHHMNDVAKTLSEENIKDLATYYSGLLSCN